MKQRPGPSGPPAPTTPDRTSCLPAVVVRGEAADCGGGNDGGDGDDDIPTIPGVQGDDDDADDDDDGAAL